MLKNFKIDIKEIILLTIVLIVASFFRLWQLESVPPGVYPDIAMNGTDAIKAMETGQYQIFYPANNGREGLFINLIAFAFQLFGVNIWALRLVGVIAGILTVLGLYLLTKEIFNKNIALWASLFLAVSFWHINFSRIGFRAIMVPLILVFLFYFLMRGLRTKKLANFVAAGVLFGLGFHTYIAFRTTPLILLVLSIAIILVMKKGLSFANLQRTVLYNQQILIFIIATVIFISPIAFYFAENPADFMGRTGDVAIWNTENSFEALIDTVIRTLAMFNFEGDSNWRHNYSGAPQLYFPIGILAILGFIYVVLKTSAYVVEKVWIKNKNCFEQSKEKKISFITKNHLSFISNSLLIAWFFAMLVPAILTYEGLPHALRVIGVIPVVFIFAAIGLDLIIKVIREILKRTRFFLTKPKFILNLAIGFGLAIFIVNIALFGFWQYFTAWAKNPETIGAFNQNLRDLGNYIKDRCIYHANSTCGYDTIYFVVVNEEGVKVGDLPVSAQSVKFIAYKNPNDIRYILPDQFNRVWLAEKENKKIEVLFMKRDENQFSEFENRFGVKIEQEERFYKAVIQ